MALESMTTPEEMLAGFEGFGLCEVDVEWLEADVTVTYSPSPEDGQAHVAVRGITKGMRRRLAHRARVVVTPTPRLEA